MEVYSKQSIKNQAKWWPLSRFLWSRTCRRSLRRSPLCSNVTGKSVICYLLRNCGTLWLRFPQIMYWVAKLQHWGYYTQVQQWHGTIRGSSLQKSNHKQYGNFIFYGELMHCHIRQQYMAMSVMVSMWTPDHYTQVGFLTLLRFMFGNMHKALVGVTVQCPQNG